MPTLNPLSWFPQRRKAAETSTSSGIGSAQREQLEMGPWSGVLGGFVARQVNPALFEALREAVPLLDAGINVLVALDGVVRVEGNNAALVAEIEDWMQSVRVNDAEIGFQAFYASMGNECFEQGHAIGEWTARKDGKGVDRLRVADSKGVLYLRDGDTLRTYYRSPRATSNAGPTGLDTVESVLRGRTGVTAAAALELDYVLLDPRRVVYAVNQPEADNPYGTSKLRSLEFVSQVLLRIDNAIGRAWTRFGDPTWHLAYKTKNGKITSTELETRRKVLAQELALALASKEGGNSSDLVTATGMMDEIAVNAIGAAQVAMDPTAPLKHITEQICAKFELPPWLLGVDGTVGAGQAERQAEMVLQSSKTRWERRKPGLEALVATHLRLAGKSWKRGDWALVQELPNLQDMMKIAQAEFLHAQAAMVGGSGESPRGVDNNLRSARSPRGKRTGSVHTKAPADEDGEGWAGEDADTLRRIERRFVGAALASWWEFAAAVGEVMGFDVVRRVVSAREDADWVFPRDRLGELLVLEQRFVSAGGADDGPLLGAMFSAWTAGAESVNAELNIAQDIAGHRAEIAAALRARGGEMVRNATTRNWRTRIMDQLAAGAMDGTRASVMASRLERMFGAANSDWERLVVSEMSIARNSAKLESYRRAGVTSYDYVTVGDALVSEICASLEAGSPYAVEDPNAPRPVLSSHPSCRCVLVPHIAADE